MPIPVDASQFVIAGAAGGGLIYVFMKGSLLQMGKWKDLVVAHELKNVHLEGVNSEQYKTIHDIRDILDICRKEIAMCELDRALQSKEINDLRHLVEELKLRVEEFYGKV